MSRDPLEFPENLGFPKDLQKEPTSQIFDESFFPYKYTDEFKEAVKKGGWSKVKAYLKMIFQ